MNEYRTGPLDELEQRVANMAIIIANDAQADGNGICVSIAREFVRRLRGGGIPDEIIRNTLLYGNVG